jgi:hypothetical protein
MRLIIGAAYFLPFRIDVGWSIGNTHDLGTEGMTWVLYSPKHRIIFLSKHSAPYFQITNLKTK